MSRQDVSARKIQAADLASKRKPASGLGDELRVHVLLHMPSGVRTVPSPEPVETGWMSWRPAVSWEMEFIRSARVRERRVELALFAGLLS